MAESISAQIKERETILDVGLVIFIQPKGSPKNIRYKTAVVGWKTDYLVIIDMPILNGAYVNLVEGSSCIVRYIRCGDAYGFETKVIKNINDARLPLIYLSYPKSVEKISLRQHPRIQTRIPVQIEVAVEEEKRREVRGNILDLSVGGCLLEIEGAASQKVDLDINQRLKLVFTLKNSAECVVEIFAMIKRVQKTPNNIMAGAQFVDLSPDNFEKIRHFCESLTYK